MMKTRAAVLRKGGQPWEITELDLDEPKAGEVLVSMRAAGLCHSDEHIRATGTARLPLVGGHEGAGVIEATGPGVTRVKTGDRVACSYIPVCGTCRYCSTGHQNLCDAGKNAAIGCLTDGTFRFHDGGEDLGGMCVVGSFARHAVLSEWSCVKIEDDVPFELAALVSCGVTTGFCSAIYAGGRAPRRDRGDLRYRRGGHERRAGRQVRRRQERHRDRPGGVQARAGDGVRRDARVRRPEEAQETIVNLTRGQLADKVICTVGEMDNEVVKAAVNMTGKAGTIVITGVGYYDMVLPGGILIGYHRRMQGSLFGGANPLYDIPMILGLWQAGDIKLTELVSQRYTLDQINEGYQDMMDGKNLRGVIMHEH